ncbi:hypothetical protein BaRGS_00019159 [Batillaria attramentaria]|uniref:Uncharacterized protein n=1 Tax=Batillaria attramentaria TaxID=370345 RepID=A0ABD0KQH8_9CAEN
MLAAGTVSQRRGFSVQLGDQEQGAATFIMIRSRPVLLASKLYDHDYRKCFGRFFIFNFRAAIFMKRLSNSWIIEASRSNFGCLGFGVGGLEGGRGGGGGVESECRRKTSTNIDNYELHTQAAPCNPAKPQLLSCAEFQYNWNTGDCSSCLLA